MFKTESQKVQLKVKLGKGTGKINKHKTSEMEKKEKSPRKMFGKCWEILLFSNFFSIFCQQDY